MGGSDEGEVFLSLEDDDLIAVPAATTQEVTLAPQIQQDAGEAFAPEVVDSTFVEDASGSFEVSWPLLGMDCPDCASKAMNALNRLSQVNSSKVSATDGTVTLEIDFEKGNVSEVSTILSCHHGNSRFNNCIVSHHFICMSFKPSS